MTKLLAVFALGAAIQCHRPAPQPSPSPTGSPAAETTPTLTPTLTPEPTALPTPSPAATPTPSPTPPQDPCADLPTSTGKCVARPTTPSLFMHIVKEAQVEAEAAGYSIDGHIGHETAYLGFVVQRIKAKGFCAINGRQGGHTEDDEVWVKMPKRKGQTVNAESEHFDLIAGDGGGKYAWISYEARCRPAAF